MKEAASGGGGDSAQHHHMDDDNLHEAFEQAAMFAVAGVGLLGNCALLAALLLRRRTRRLSSAFVGHSAVLNLAMSAYCLPFGRGLVADGGVSSNTCNSLGTSYIVLMTTAAFNLVAMACCEVYFFDSRLAAEGKQPEGSVCCVMFGVAIVYTGSAILHLGPTLIGANFEATDGGSGDNGGRKCLFIYGQVKNYIVYTMWVLIVSLALTAAAYYLVVFNRTIGRTMDAKLAAVRAARTGSPPAPATAAVAADDDRRLTRLAAAKYNRQRVLAGLWCLHLVCWYPLYALILMDPQYRVTVELYKFLTIVGFARAAVEPLALLLFDGDLGRLPFRRLLRCCCGCHRGGHRGCACRRGRRGLQAPGPAAPLGGHASGDWARGDEVVVVFGRAGVAPSRRRRNRWSGAAADAEDDDSDDDGDGGGGAGVPGCSCEPPVPLPPTMAASTSTEAVASASVWTPGSERRRHRQQHRQRQVQLSQQHAPQHMYFSPMSAV